MSGGIRKRYVTGPDGTKWIVGRHWLARRPRYRGFRFGVDPYAPDYEPPAEAHSNRTPIRKPHAGPLQPPAPNPYRDNPDLSTSKPRDGGWWIFSGRPWGGSWGGGSSSGGSSGGGWTGGSSGGGFRGASGGGGRSRGGGGRGKSGGGGAGAGAAGLLGLLLKALKFIAIALAVIAAILFLVFVGLPALLFLAQYLLFWVLVIGTFAYNAITGRPWIVTAGRPGYERADYAYRIHGWTDSKTAINEIAEALRRGDHPSIANGEPVELLEH